MNMIIINVATMFLFYQLGGLLAGGINNIKTGDKKEGLSQVLSMILISCLYIGGLLWLYSKGM